MTAWRRRSCATTGCSCARNTSAAARWCWRSRTVAALLDTDRTLQRGIALRNPYIDPMHFMQVDLLERWRASGRQNRELFEALQASVSGIARGLQTTG